MFSIWFLVTGRSNENICCNFLSQWRVEFKFDLPWDCLQLSFLSYMKVNGMRIKEILKRIWLLSANKIKPSESICKQSSQVKLEIELNMSFWQIITAIYCRHGRAGHSFGFQNSKIDSFLYSKAFCSPYICLARKQMRIKKIAQAILLFLCVRFLKQIQLWLMKFLIMSVYRQNRNFISQDLILLWSFYPTYLKTMPLKLGKGLIFESKVIVVFVKFSFSEKATKICAIFLMVWTLTK